jgi:5,10-methylenetetrahydrofolate reductase
MTKIADIHPPSGSQPLFICDFSPPRGAAYDDIDAAHTLAADCLSVPYNPGKSVFASSAFAAHSIRAATGKEVAFTIATRDMNILAAQSLLLGAALLGLRNVIVVRGDNFTPADLRHTKPVNDRTATSLIRSIAGMNEGTDFRGRALGMQTDLCIGAAIDTNRDIDSEVTLTRRKIEAGAHFLITQPGFTPEVPLNFLEAYRLTYGEHPSIPLFFGVQMIAAASRSFSPIPQSVRNELDSGASSADIAARAIEGFLVSGITSFYLMPPILPGGNRDYESARLVLDRFKTSQFQGS